MSDLIVSFLGEKLKKISNSFESPTFLLTRSTASAGGTVTPPPPVIGNILLTKTWTTGVALTRTGTVFDYTGSLAAPLTDQSAWIAGSTVTDFLVTFRRRAGLTTASAFNIGFSTEVGQPTAYNYAVAVSSDAIGNPTSITRFDPASSGPVTNALVKGASEILYRVQRASGATILSASTNNGSTYTNLYTYVTTGSPLVYFKTRVNPLTPNGIEIIESVGV